MRTEQAAPVLGIAGCLAAVAALALPFALFPGWGAELGQYYTGGPLGVGAVLAFALVGVVVFLAGARGRTDATTAAGIAVPLGVVAFLVALSWALSASLDPLFGFPASWITELRWVVLAATGLVTLAAGLYARATLG
ncbi:DUF7548 family protein [Haloplanus pelagicus]|jgi:hypothetical protein|uniref:DUF7548 family protein n=1 Tax=Haloplanus pelagicus TaxID=2949995 RepID=UPI00203EBA13|nr:hypothetical protein [Haloplanus sp. HW8-1]